MKVASVIMCISNVDIKFMANCPFIFLLAFRVWNILGWNCIKKWKTNNFYTGNDRAMNAPVLNGITAYALRAFIIENNVYDIESINIYRKNWSHQINT